MLATTAALATSPVLSSSGCSEGHPEELKCIFATMAKHKSIFLFLMLAFAPLANGQVRPMACDILSAIAKEGSVFYGSQSAISLIDTTRFFTPVCNGSFGRYHISIINENVLHASGKEQFYVSIGANKDGFAVGIFRWPSNSITVYWFNILDGSISISKIRSGDF